MNDVRLHFNRDPTEALRGRLGETLAAEGRNQGLGIQTKGLFTLEPAEGERLKMTFLEEGQG